MNYPRGLIRYTTQNTIDGRPSRLLRPRILVYGTLLLLLLTAWGWGVTHRHSFLVEALRDRNALYRIASDGSLQNSYQLKLVNKLQQAREFRVELDAHGEPLSLQGGSQIVRAEAGEVLAVPVTVVGPASVHGRVDVDFVVTPLPTGASRNAASRFFGPFQ